MKVARGMVLLFKDDPPEGVDRPSRFELVCVTAVRGNSVQLVRCTESIVVTYTARFPDKEIKDPFKHFDLSQKDLELVWNAT